LPYDSKVDVFSAGVILYILLTGCSPFYGETYNEILVKNKQCKVNYELEELKVKVSDSAIDLLKKMLEKDPK
jgi:serine/threonine protein kinase